MTSMTLASRHPSQISAQGKFPEEERWADLDQAVVTQGDQTQEQGAMPNDMEGLNKSDLKKKAMLNNYLIKQSDSLLDIKKILNEGNEDQQGLCERIPGAGILLIIFCVIIYQCGNVAAKKMTAPPFMMIFLRDVGSLFMMTPVNIAIAAPVYQR